MTNVAIFFIFSYVLTSLGLTVNPENVENDHLSTRQASLSRPRNHHRRQYDGGESGSFYKGEPEPELTEAPDSNYYPGFVEYYTDEESSQERQMITFTTQSMVKWKPGMSIYMPDTFIGTDDHEDSLTREAWAALPNKRELRQDRRNATRYWRQYLHKMDREGSYSNFLNRDEYIQLVCYQIGTTFLHAKRQLPEYYRIRYAYYNKKEFEIGYVVHEIVYKYTALLEIFHNVQARFYNRSRFVNIATASYMLYMYSNIVDLSQTIIHLCNILSEMETKYGHRIAEAPDYYDEEWEAKKALMNGGGGGGEQYSMYMDEVEKQRLRRKRLRKQRRKELEAMKKSGVYSSTKRTRRPRSFNHFPRHYGWSIEYW